MSNSKGYSLQASLSRQIDGQDSYPSGSIPLGGVFYDTILPLKSVKGCAFFDTLDTDYRKKCQEYRYEI